MFSAHRRHVRYAAPTRCMRAGRGGFTLVELLVSVTLVLLMMLMFAEIYGLAQNTISTQRGIAENDQKARILAEVLRTDLRTRTLRSVYPFRYERVDDFALSDSDRNLLKSRQGYFSFSENDPSTDTDDVLQFTVMDGRYSGSAATLPTSPASYEESKNEPEFDDGASGDGSGASTAAEVSYFLRDGNLYRSILLLRKPHLDSASGQPSLDPSVVPSPLADYRVHSGNSFWRDFDYSAYRWFNTTTGDYELQFHTAPHGSSYGSLNNDPLPSGIPPDEYIAVGSEILWAPKALSVPFLRFGHLAYQTNGFPSGMPLEYSTAPSDFASVVNAGRSDFFGRYKANERSHPSFGYPGSGDVTGSGWAPFNGMAVPPATYDYPERRGIDLMLPNVHAFDIEVWDDLINGGLGGFVDLGYSSNTTVGYYHESRLRQKNNTVDHPAAPIDFGNRYDTWSPRFYIGDATGTPVSQARFGRAPYRPQEGNADPNDTSFIEVEFGRQETTMLEPAGEKPLRAIRITVRYIDPASGQLRQTTIEESLID